MSFKKVKVVMLPTKEKANLLLTGRNDLYYSSKLSDFSLKEDVDIFQHLYFLSDEEIKEGDWCIMLDDFGNVFSNPQQYTDPNTQHLNKGLRKIIATTDRSLGLVVDQNNCPMPAYSKFLPQPSQLFIEKFVDEYNKRNVITEVMVEYERVFKHNKFMEREFFDASKVNPKDNTITIRKVKDDWNREEVIQLLKKLAEDIDCGYRIYTRDNSIGFDMVNNDGKWIEENL